MLFLLTQNLIYSLMTATAFWAFFFQYSAIFITLGIIIIVIVSIVSRIFVKKKKGKKKGEVIRPVYDIIGNDAERIEELNRDLNAFGFAYEPYEDIFLSIMNPWQRQLGYCRLYDEASAALSMIIDCEPIRFEYNGKKWLIEFWKGQYGMTTGGEVGIYYTTGPDINIPGIFNGTFYFCVKDEDRINMSFVLRKNGNILFTRSDYHWWLTGFKLGEFTNPSELSMDITLELLDRQMAYAFLYALQKAGYKENEYAIQGKKVYIRYSKPHTSQPLTRTAFTDFIMQRNNESLCDAYNQLTESYSETLDKLVIVRKESPTMYNQILHMGKPKAVYDAYSTLKSHLK
ncbi:MAG: hypothetical protein K0S76_1192 [Herbinix sp.]|nr:hypothetical protein [Herbinix sp.]